VLTGVSLLMNNRSMDTDSQSYKETPPISKTNDLDPNLYPPPKPPENNFSVVTVVVVFLILAGIGFWFSGYFRTYFSSFFSTKPAQTQKTTLTPTPPSFSTEGATPATTSAATPTQGAWKTYKVLNGITREGFSGLSFQLPPEVLATTCDGSRCISQGTYLPGKTRFTVALRGVGQALPDYRGNIISELGGVPMAVKDVTLLGRTVTEYSADFTGTTVNGYKFTQMHGYMMPLTDTAAFEINHFTPNGAVTDFAGDEIVFKKIVDSLVLPPYTSTPSATGSPSATPMIEK